VPQNSPSITQANVIYSDLEIPNKSQATISNDGNQITGPQGPMKHAWRLEFWLLLFGAWNLVLSVLNPQATLEIVHIVKTQYCYEAASPSLPNLKEN
jgi:hypothetical protein